MEPSTQKVHPVFHSQKTGLQINLECIFLAPTGAQEMLREQSEGNRALREHSESTQRALRASIYESIQSESKILRLVIIYLVVIKKPSALGPQP